MREGRGVEVGCRWGRGGRGVKVDVDGRGEGCGGRL